jgi:ABC-2 type transport system permease protein
MTGGKAIFLIDTIDIDERTMQGRPINSPIGKLLECYGAKVPNELVLDQMNAEASFQSGPYSISIPYPFWVQVVPRNSENNHPITYSLDSMVLPWASPVEIIKDKNKTFSTLVQSSEYSWLQKDFFDFSPQNIYMPPEDQMNKHIMAVAISGKFSSFFADKPFPSIEKEKGKESQEKTRPVIKESHETKIIVVGNSRFVTDNFSTQFDGNKTFLLNAIDWFTIGDYLIDIRSRESGERPLEIISDKTKIFIRAVNMFGVSILLAAFGLVQFYLRRRRKKLGVVL